jgi:hypothetical protein
MVKKVQPASPNPLVKGSSAGVRAGLPAPSGHRGANVGKTIGAPKYTGRAVPKGTPGPTTKKGK